MEEKNVKNQQKSRLFMPQKILQITQSGNRNQWQLITLESMMKWAHSQCDQ